MLKLALCDDDESELSGLCQLVREYMAVRGETGGRLDAFCDGASLIDAARQIDGYDIYLMDILMPGFDGIQTARELRGLFRRGEIIYLSNANDYAADSYSVGAFYYLLKPVEREALFDVLDGALNKLSRSRHTGMMVNTREGVHRVLLDDILYAERSGRIMRLHCSDGVVDSLTLRCSFRDAAMPLLEDRRFYMCGASYVLNLCRVAAVEGQSATFDNGEKVVLPRLSAADFKAAWGKYWLEGDAEP